MQESDNSSGSSSSSSTKYMMMSLEAKEQTKNRRLTEMLPERDLVFLFYDRMHTRCRPEKCWKL